MDRGSWRATVHGMPKVGHNRSDLAHSHANLGAARWKRCMGMWEGGQGFQAVSPNLHVLTHLEAPQKQFQGHVTGFRAGSIPQAWGAGYQEETCDRAWPLSSCLRPHTGCAPSWPQERNTYVLFMLFAFFLIYFFWLRLAACGILVSRPGIEPAPLH